MNDRNLEFMQTASLNTLEEYELSRRNSAANLAKQLRALMYEVIDEMVDADLARIMRQLRNLSPAIETKATEDPLRIE